MDLSRKFWRHSLFHLFLILSNLPSSVLAKLLFPDGTPKPEFVGAVENVTVPVGRDAIFTCNVKNLGRFRIGWVKSDTKAIQSIHDSVITHNQRVQVTGDFVSMFNLHIHRVQQEDQGQYMCQINTDPMMQQTATLDVNIPPDIKIEKTSKDFETQIGSTATLECHAEGYPDPSISWLREGKKFLRVKEPSGDIKNYERYDGNRLVIPQVVQDDMGGYLCIANNKVPPAMSKRVFMYVQFPPQVVARESLVGVLEGRTVQMRCDVIAYPKPIVYWMHEGNMVLTNSQFDVFENETSKSEMFSSIVVRNVSIANMGKYQCVAKNDFGAAEANIRAYLVSSTESPGTTSNTGSSKETTEEEDQKRSKKRRRQKSERQKVEENLIENELGFGSISSENMHGPGYTTFEQNLEKVESRSSNVRKVCSNLVFISIVVMLIR